MMPFNILLLLLACCNRNWLAEAHQLRAYSTGPLHPAIIALHNEELSANTFLGTLKSHLVIFNEGVSYAVTYASSDFKVEPNMVRLHATAVCCLPVFDLRRR